MLTEDQVAHFRAFGFVLVRQLFGPDEQQVISDEYDRGLEFARDGATPVGHRRQLNWPNLGPRTPFLATLPEDPRICGMAEQLFGADTVGVASNGNHFTGEYTEWHPDTTDPHFHGVKFLLYLDPLAADTGALRVIPSSHRSPFHEQLRRIALKEANLDAGSEAGLSICEVPAYACETGPGDAILFNFRTWHGTWGGTQGRRMCSMMFYSNPATPEEEEATRAMVDLNREVQESLKWKEPQYHPDWIANPGNNPRRQRWIGWLQHWGFLKKK